MKNLEGKIAFITDGVSGIGRAAAKEFKEEGTHLVIVGRSQEILDATKLEGEHVGNRKALERVGPVSRGSNDAEELPPCGFCCFPASSDEVSVEESRANPNTGVISL